VLITYAERLCGDVFIISLTNNHRIIDLYKCGGRARGIGSLLLYFSIILMEGMTYVSVITHDKLDIARERRFLPSTM